MNRPLSPMPWSIALACLLAACATTSPPAPTPPPPPPGPTPGALNVTLSGDALFAFGKSGIDGMSPGGLAQLDALATRLQAIPAYEVIRVIGHSDRIGNDRDNLALSHRRAAAVRDYLVQAGIPADRITAVGRGSVEPVADCATERGQALVDCLAPDRRVEVKVVLP